MAAAPGALVAPTSNAALEGRLRARLDRRREKAGSFSEMEPLAVRLGLIQNAEAPSLESVRIVVFAADHGLAVDDIAGPGPCSTVPSVLALLDESLPLAAFARVQGIELVVVDSGVAETLAPHPRLLARKIAHGTRNSRAGAAMSTEQAHAALRAGMEIGRSSAVDAIACAGIGVGAAPSAALLLACLSGAPLHEFVSPGQGGDEAFRKHLIRVLDDARNRHGHLEDPVELLAAVGGFETAMMAGLMLAAASRRRLVICDGLCACAALLVAAAIAPAVPDYCIHTRSNSLSSLDNALDLFGVRALTDTGIDSIDGTGAALAWPIARCAAALLDIADAPPHSGGSQSGARADRPTDVTWM